MRSLARPVVKIVVVTVGVLTFMLLTDMGPNIALMVSLCALIGVAVWFVADLAKLPIGTDVVVPAPEPVQLTDRRVMRLRGGLVPGQRDDRSLLRLREGLVDLIDDQLRHAHQIDRSVQPEAARAVLGSELWTFVDDPSTAQGLGQPQRIDRILTLIEQL